MRAPSTPSVGPINRLPADALAAPASRLPLESHPGASRRRLFHRIAEVRRLQGVTIRNVARRLGLAMPLVRRQEQSDCDLHISDLHRWQQVLEVPVAELLVEGEGALSGPVLHRSRMVKLMKTAAAIRDRTVGSPAERMADMLIDQLVEIMPELANVTPWHESNAKRSSDDLGKAACCPISEDLFLNR